ncbi:MAG: SMP-30/gluconolactonase/LRE family protein, partial [Dolichospermum sp.]
MVKILMDYLLKSEKYRLNNVLAARSRLGEGPVWDSTTGLLYWVDIYNHRVNQFDPTTGKNLFFDVGDVVAAIAIADQDRLIMAQRHQLAFLY